MEWMIRLSYQDALHGCRPARYSNTASNTATRLCQPMAHARPAARSKLPSQGRCRTTNALLYLHRPPSTVHRPPSAVRRPRGPGHSSPDPSTSPRKEGTTRLCQCLCQCLSRCPTTWRRPAMVHLEAAGEAAVGGTALVLWAECDPDSCGYIARVSIRTVDRCQLLCCEEIEIRPRT